MDPKSFVEKSRSFKDGRHLNVENTVKLESCEESPFSAPFSILLHPIRIVSSVETDANPSSIKAKSFTPIMQPDRQNSFKPRMLPSTPHKADVVSVVMETECKIKFSNTDK